jgi:hypothetical protein
LVKNAKKGFAGGGQPPPGLIHSFARLSGPGRSRCLVQTAVLYYSFNVYAVIEFNEAAFRHGVARQDIRWAIAHYLYDGHMEDEVYAKDH